MSEAVVAELSVVASEPNLKSQLGREVAEVALARGTIAARICAQESLLATVDGLPDIFGHQRQEINEKLTQLGELQASSDTAVTAWYRAERENVQAKAGSPETDALVAWLALLPRVQARLHALRTRSEAEAFPLLDSVNDACEDLFLTINEVTDDIETARQAEQVAIEQDMELAPEIVAMPPAGPPPTLAREKAPAATILSLPDNFIERLQTFLVQKPQTHIAEIVREFFGVPRLEPAMFGVLRTVLHEADGQGLVRNLAKGYYASTTEVGQPANARVDSGAAAAARQRERELDEKLKALNLGGGPAGLKPRQRGRRYAAKR